MKRSANTMGSEILGYLDLGNADARALRGRFDHQRQTHRGQRAGEIRDARQHGVLGRGVARAHHHALGLELVHGECRGQHAAAGVRDTQPFEGTLHHAVFAPRPVQRNPCPVEFVAAESLYRRIERVEGVRIHPAPLQGRKHGIAAQQGNLALRRITAQEDGDLAEVGGDTGTAAGRASVE